MYELLPITWYFDTPIDYEHKQYCLLAYLLKVDNDFLNKVLSPHLLHLEKLKTELIEFNSSYIKTINSFEKGRYIYLKDDNQPKLENPHILEIKEIVDFSIPLINLRIDLGYQILNQKKQVLY